MEIKGLQKLTLIDYPGEVACTVFLAGCNFRCPWCYSPELVLLEKSKKQPKIAEKRFFQFLKERKGKIDGVVVCGGEPTVFQKLPWFLREIKKERFLVKLDTNGSKPEVLKKILEKNLLDYIAMDVKVPLAKYEILPGLNVKKEKIKESIDLIKNSGVDYEFRTTVVPGIHQKEDIEKIAQSISPAKRYFLQSFLPQKTLCESFLKKKPFSREEMEEFKKTADRHLNSCVIR